MSNKITISKYPHDKFGWTTVDIALFKGLHMDELKLPQKVQNALALKQIEEVNKQANKLIKQIKESEQQLFKLHSKDSISYAFLDGLKVKEQFNCSIEPLQILANLTTQLEKNRKEIEDDTLALVYLENAHCKWKASLQSACLTDLPDKLEERIIIKFSMVDKKIQSIYLILNLMAWWLNEHKDIEFKESSDFVLFLSHVFDLEPNTIVKRKLKPLGFCRKDLFKDILK